MQKVEKEKNKNDFNNTIKQIKENMNSKFANIQETINSLTTESKEMQKQFNNKNVRYGSNDTKKYICFYCAKPNHRFENCKNAREEEKNAIRTLLKEKKFDYRKLREKAYELEQQRNEKYGQMPLNSKPPSQ